MALITTTAALGAGTNGGASAPGELAEPPSLPGDTAPASTAAPVPTRLGRLQPPAGGAIVRSATLVRGNLAPVLAGRSVALEMFEAHGGWSPVGGAKVHRSGNFVVVWRPRHIGRFLLRASLGAAATASALAAGPSVPVEVYRPVTATWFGPGSYGSRTACGQILSPELLGVAHRTLPCGTRIDILYGKRRISVPVVDRGPFVSGVSYDLTAATAQTLGVSGTVRIGAVAIRGRTPAAP